MIDMEVEELDGGLKIGYKPESGGKMRLKAMFDGNTLLDSDYPASVFSEPSVMAGFTNAIEDALAPRTGVDAAEMAQVAKEWCATMRTDDKEARLETFHTPIVREIVEGTEAVQVHGGENTTVLVRLTYQGDTNELEFTTSEWLADSPGALQEKMFNSFFDIVDVEEEGWQEIRDQWDDQKEEEYVVNETAKDAVAERVIEFLRNAAKPVAEQEDMGNGVEACWYDEHNSAGYGNAADDAPIVWVQGSFLVDQLEEAGKQVGYKGELCKTLISRGDMHGERTRRRWVGDNNSRSNFFPFKPQTLGVTPDDVADGSGDAYSEVDV